MILGIDASNLRAGGGVTHIIEILRVAEPQKYGFSKVIIWSGAKTLHRISSQPWLEKVCPPELNKNAFFRIFWQNFQLQKQLKMNKCDLLFVPGGLSVNGFYPMVTMCRNLLPFEWKELFRYGLSFFSLKLLLLRIAQLRTFNRANGLIFLTEYAKNVILKNIRKDDLQTMVIPHGVNTRFALLPKTQLPIGTYSQKDPIRIIYVSVVDLYKHQWNVVDAVMRLFNKGIPLRLDIIGPSTPVALKRLYRAINRLDPDKKSVNYLGVIPHEELHEYYKKSDIFLFASSCENMPNILLEGMASGLPIVCSSLGPMPEVLGDAGVYFNPENPQSIADALVTLIESPNLRENISKRSYESSLKYSWKRCADETFKYLKNILMKIDD